MQLKEHSVVTQLHLGSACADFTCGLPCIVYATFFHFPCPQRAYFYFFWALLVCISEFLFLNFYSQVYEECLGNGCNVDQNSRHHLSNLKKASLCFLSIYLGARSAEALNSDVSDLAVFRKVCDASVPSQGCLNFLTEPCVRSGIIALTLALCIADASQKI